MVSGVEPSAAPFVERTTRLIEHTLCHVERTPCHLEPAVERSVDRDRFLDSGPPGLRPE